MPGPLDGSTVALWHFGAGTGTTVTDDSGHGLPGTASNMAWVTGKFGPAGSFNAANALVNFGTSAAFNPPQITLEAWIYPTNATGGEQTILRKTANDNSLIYDFQILEEKLFLRLNGNSGEARTSNGSIRSNRWYHVAGTYDGSTMRLYINGQLAGSTNYSQALRIGTSTSLYLGGDGQFNQNYFAGLIQHAAFSNNVRSSFPYASLTAISNEPTLAAGSATSPPQAGQPGLGVDFVLTTDNGDGSVTVFALVSNTGAESTGNGFTTDLHLDHQPSGPGDYAGSVSTWYASPVGSNGAVTLSARVSLPLPTRPSGAPRSPRATPAEATHMLYVQTDSSGVLRAVNDPSRPFIASLPVCVAEQDQFEPDDSTATATSLPIGSTARHNIGKPGDVDFTNVTLVAGTRYRFSTTLIGSSVDTVLGLHDAAGVLLASNDDSSGTLASYVEWYATQGGTYFVRVEQWSPATSGCETTYDLAVAVVRSILEHQLSAVSIGSEVAIFGRNSASQLWYRETVAGVWSGWSLLPTAPIASRPEAIVRPNGDLYVFYRGAANDLRYIGRAGGTWGADSSLGGVIGGEPVAAVDGSGNLVVVAKAPSGQPFYQKLAPGAGSFGGWVPLDGRLFSRMELTNYAGDLYLFGLDAFASLYVKRWDGIANSWDPWIQLGGVVGSAPAAAAYGGSLYVFGLGDGGGLFYRLLTVSTWAPWINLGGVLGGSPDVAATASRVVLSGTNPPGESWAYAATGNGFLGWEALGGVVGVGPETVAVGDSVYAFALTPSGVLFFRLWDAGAWGPWTNLGGVLAAE